MYMVKNTNDFFKSVIAEVCYGDETLENNKKFERVALVVLWLLTPWLGMYGMISRIVRTLSGRP